MPIPDHISIIGPVRGGISNISDVELTCNYSAVVLGATNLSWGTRHSHRGEFAGCPAELRRVGGSTTFCRSPVRGSRTIRVDPPTKLVLAPCAKVPPMSTWLAPSIWVSRSGASVSTMMVAAPSTVGRRPVSISASVDAHDPQGLSCRNVLPRVLPDRSNLHLPLTSLSQRTISHDVLSPVTLISQIDI
jgi:hypothetical protein